MDQTLPTWAKAFPTDNALNITKLIYGTCTKLTLQDNNTKKCLTFGRNPDNDVILDQLSCSRKHAMLCYGTGPEIAQNSQEAFWICDLNTQNGTIMNDSVKLDLSKFYLIKNGYFFQFGINNEKYVIEYEHNIADIDDYDDDDDDDDESIDNVKTDIDSIIEKNESCVNWGQSYDAESNTPQCLVVNNDPPPPIDDPIGVVKKFFKREGCAFNPEFTKLNSRFQTVFDASLILPIEDTNIEGSNETVLTAQGDTKNEALRCVCKLAYELLYSQNLLNKKITESYETRKKRQLIENDYYESDDDTFYDRTGIVEHKRARRIELEKNENKNLTIISGSSKIKSYFDKTLEYIPSKKINSRLSEVNKLLVRVKSELERAKSKKKKYVETEWDDEAEKNMVTSEKDELINDIKNWSEKLKKLTKDREHLLKQLEYSKDVESRPDYKESLHCNDSSKIIGNTTGKHCGNEIVEEIIRAYTDPESYQKIKKHEQLTTQDLEKPTHQISNPKSTTPEKSIPVQVQNVLKDTSNKTSYDLRDMIETDTEKIFDDSPISWIPPADNTKEMNNLKNKYGY